MFFRQATKRCAGAAPTLARSTCQGLSGQLGALFFFVIAFFATPALATTYTFSGSSFPACSNGSWSLSGSTWDCAGNFTLSSGDTILPSSAVTVLAEGGMTLAGNNTVGSSTIAVNLSSTWGAITIGGTSTIFGNITSNTGNLTLTSTTVNGSITTSGWLQISGGKVTGAVSANNGVTSTNATVFSSSVTSSNGAISFSGGSVAGNVSGSNGVTSTNGTVFSGSVSASNGEISLSGGSVAGNLVSGCCTITANNVNIGGGISTTVISSSHNTIIINGGSVAGAISSSGGNGVQITNATVTSGSITTTNVPITISGSTIGSASNQVNIASNNNVTLSNTTVYGNVTAGNWPDALKADSSTVIYGVCTSNSTNSINLPQNYPRCTSSGGATVTAFNACHDYASSACAKATARLYTQKTGTAFTTDIIALKSDGSVNTAFTGKVTVSVIARASTGGALDANNCFTPDMEQVLDGAATAFTAGRLSLGANFSTAYPDVRFKIVCANTVCVPSGITTCSGDDFAVRPNAFSSVTTPVDANGVVANADATGTSFSATPVVKAGAALTITATAGVGYNGTPKIDASKIVTAVSGHVPGTLGGTFNAATAAAGIATSSQFTYSEVGYFRFNDNGIYDNAFTIVDQRTDGNDCTADYSNTANNGKIGCYFGNDQKTSYFGRFVADHFDTAVTDACAVGTFTYAGQPFGVTVTAKNASGETTKNYTGSFAKDTTLSVRDPADKTNNPGPGTLQPSIIAATAFDHGVAKATPNYTFNDVKTAPTTIRLRASEPEVSSLRSPATATAEGSTTVLSGRAQLVNAYGSELLPLPLTLRLQYWSGTSGWQINAADTCTAISASNFAFGFPANTGNNLTACETALTVSGSAPNYKLSLSAPGANNDGWATVALNLGATGTGTQCIAVGGTGAASTTVNAPWLQYNWTGTVGNPQAQATFGKYRSGPVIFRRETY